MNNKTLSIVSYIIPIGWLISYFLGKDKADALLKYHLKQSLGLGIVSIALNVILGIIVRIMPSLAFLSIVGWVIIVFWILGIINAANSALKPIPVFGKAFENSFSFIG